MPQRWDEMHRPRGESDFQGRCASNWAIRWIGMSLRPLEAQQGRIIQRCLRSGLQIGAAKCEIEASFCQPTRHVERQF